METKDFRQEIEKLLKRLESRKFFSFSKYADGEWAIMRNISIGTSEFYYNPEVDTRCRPRLIESFQFRDEEYYVGVSCPCCQGDEHYKMIEFSKQDLDHLTFANIFVNSNYAYFKDRFIPEFRNWDVHLVANSASSIQDLPFPVEKFYPVEFNAWDTNYSLIEEIKAQNLSNKLFLFACGAFGNMLAHQLWSSNKMNTYLDIGSTLNVWLKTGIPRQYVTHGLMHKVCTWGVPH